MPTDSILVMGAGLQGVCAALALEARGHTVVLVDRARDCMLRTSLRNEGKIHLGFVYANDPSFQTPSLMLEASMEFAQLIEGWLGGPVDWTALRSRPFTYLILHESLVPRERILECWEHLDEQYRSHHRDTRSTYLGERPDRLLDLQAGARLNGFVHEDRAAAVVRTAEAAIDLAAFRGLLRSRLQHVARIEGLFAHRVETVTRTPEGFRVEGRTEDGKPWCRDAGVVVNCTWEDRLRIDQQLGLCTARPWVYRLKYRLLGRLPDALDGLPSLTLVLGAFGDVVVEPSRRLYLSWYPACLKGWSADLTIPPEWEPACAGRVDPADARTVVAGALSAFNAVVPGLAGCAIDVVDAGVIFSWGATDIDDPTSELHRRHDIGVNGFDGYFTIDTGKLTCAPMFARRLAEMIG